MVIFRVKKFGEWHSKHVFDIELKFTFIILILCEKEVKKDNRPKIKKCILKNLNSKKIENKLKLI